MNLYEHMKQQRPALDKNRKFMFFGNHKVGLGSVNRGILKNRVILWKENKDTYDNIFDSYPVKEAFKFTIVRNPFKRMPSAYFYLRDEKIIHVSKLRNFIKKDFKKLGTKIDKHFHVMYPNAFFRGKQFVHYIAKLENITHDWKRIAKNIKCPLRFPHLHASSHKKRNYYLDDEAIAIISKIYIKDLEYFNYRRLK